MNAEALIGTVLGTCTLQRILGQGGMGAVYLAQQSRPHRQVAVKVLLPMIALTAQQRAAFLERFRRETDAAASLEHPNILPVYEYGERDTLTYLVMPYISSGTLRDVMEREPQLPFAQVMTYLDQLAAALACAHSRGVIHRDIKPANILITPDGRLLLSDFGLVKIVADGRSEYARITGAGAPVGTPDYMAPEQVIGSAVDGRADLYSLGIIIYQMLTGKTPFQGETPMHIAAQHLQSPPPPPRMFRPDLPPAVEQALLRALEKQPGKRFERVQDFAVAFRAAFTTAEQSPGAAHARADAPSMNASSTTRPFKRGGLFDPSWQTGAMGKLPLTAPANQGNKQQAGIVLPAAQHTTPAPVRPTGLLSRAGMFPKGGAEQPPALTNTNLEATSPRLVLPGSVQVKQPVAGLADQATGPLAIVTSAQPPRGQNTTASMKAVGAQRHATNTIKLTGPVQVVQAPVVGQPGLYVTGLLPLSPTTEELVAPPATTKAPHRKHRRAVALTLLLLACLVGSGLLLFHNRIAPFSRSANPAVGSQAGTPNVAATSTAKVLATVAANQILSDPLTQNIHNWPVSANEFFLDGAYHILNNQNNGGLAVVLAQKAFDASNALTVTMWQVKGNQSSPNNSFGMILRFNQVTKAGKSVTTFYSFEVVNEKGGLYRFYKYDNSHGTPDKYWTQLWQQPFGNEFHQGQGINNANTIVIYQNGNHFTFTVNGKQVGSLSDNSFKSGTIGMLVNLKGTEVAFSNLLITHH